MNAPSTATGIAQYADDCEHIAEELVWLDLLLARRVVAFRASLGAPEAASGQQMYISHAEIDRLLTPQPAALDREESCGELAAQRARIDARISRTLESRHAPALVRLAQLFHLSPFEQRVLIVCLAPELEPKYDKIYAYLHDDVTRRRPSARLVLDLLCDSAQERWYARAQLAESGNLLRNGLLQYWDDLANLSGNGDFARVLRVDPAIVNYFLGVDRLDRRLEPAGTLLVPTEDETADGDLVARLAALAERHLDPARGGGRLVINLHGAPGSVARDLALATARRFGRPLLCVALDQLPAGEQGTDHPLRLALRQGLLWQVPVCLEQADGGAEPSDGGSAARRLAASLAEYSQLTFLITRRPWQGAEWLDGCGFHAIRVPFPDVTERTQAWQAALDRIGAEPGWAPPLARQFRLTPSQIARAAQAAVNEHVLAGGETGLTPDELAAACRRQSQHALADLALRIEPAYTWDQLILPAAQKERLHELCAQLRHVHRVFHEWGFGARFSHGRGLSALFTGAPGTGKTMAAEVIATDLGLELYKIDLSAVVSKYIGETEKNLSRVFREAEASNAILFFDEADALFGKRTEVSDAHDRYANIETSFLLQKMEEYEGVVILASNLRENMDEAFVRRLRFIVDFPFPEQADRLHIWRTHFPATAPVGDDLDLDHLATRLPVAGGNIKNIVLNAAFLAAAERDSIAMRHVLHAARREFEKIGKRWDETRIVPAPGAGQRGSDRR